MASSPYRYKINRSTVVATGVQPTAIVAGVDGYAYSVTEVIAANLEGSTITLNMYEGVGGDKLCPQLAIGASGTAFIDEFAGDKLPLGIGSGVYATLDSDVVSGAEITVYYVTYDERTPITKSTARNTTYTASAATRKPNEFGAQ